MIYTEWQRSLSAIKTLAEVYEEFVESGDGQSSIAENLLIDPPSLDDMSGFDAITMLSFHICRYWTEEWAALKDAKVYISKPVLLVSSTWLTQHDDRPSINVSMASSIQWFDPASFIGAKPIATSTGNILSRAAANCGFVACRSSSDADTDWLFYSQAAAELYQQRLRLVLPRLTRERQVDCLLKIVSFLSDCSQKYSVTSRTIREIEVDSRLCALSDIINLVLSSLREIYFGNSSIDTFEFVNNFTSAATFGQIEYEVSCACDWLFAEYSDLTLAASTPNFPEP